MSDKISVIIPVYKVEKYLRRCIESVITQTYENIEIILVDDESPDDSGKICDIYAAKDSRIKVIHKKNGGAAAARNIGIDVATGRYICFVDSDDYVKTTFVERLYTLITENDADIAQCGFIKTAEEKTKFADNKFAQVDVVDAESTINNLYLYNELYLRTVVVWTKMYKKELFDKVRFYEGIIYEDEEIMPKLLFEAKKIVATEEELYAYFMSPDSVMRTEFSLKRFDFFKALESRASFYKSKGLLSFYFKDMCIMMVKSIEYSFVITDRDNKKELLKKSAEYYREIMKSDMRLKTKFRYTLYRLHPIFVKIL